jgi:hypothetical protein
VGGGSGSTGVCGMTYCGSCGRGLGVRCEVCVGGGHNVSGIQGLHSGMKISCQSQMRGWGAMETESAGGEAQMTDKDHISWNVGDVE